LNTQSNVLLLKPVGYFEFLALLKNARLVITDSGGVQEAFILGKNITLRKTEWPETMILGYNMLVNQENLNEVIQAIMNSLDQAEPSKQPLRISPLGDGNAGKRIARLLRLFAE